MDDPAAAADGAIVEIFGGRAAEWRPLDTDDAGTDDPGTAASRDAAPPSRPPVSDHATTALAVLDSHLLERDPEVRAALQERLAGADVSGRETKRLLNVWQFNLRVALHTQPDIPYAAGVQLARHLVIAAEILTRWPAMLRQLSTSFDGRPALTTLADVVNDDVGWGRTIGRLKLDKPAYHAATRQLRALLRDNDAKIVADLTASLL